MATARETTSENSAAFHAVIRSTPSRMKRVNRGSMATSAVSASDPETASRTGRYIGHLVFGRDGTYVLLRRPGGATGWCDQVEALSSRHLGHAALIGGFPFIWSYQSVGLTIVVAVS